MLDHPYQGIRYQRTFQVLLERYMLLDKISYPLRYDEDKYKEQSVLLGLGEVAGRDPQKLLRALPGLHIVDELLDEVGSDQAERSRQDVQEDEPGDLFPESEGQTAEEGGLTFVNIILFLVAPPVRTEAINILLDATLNIDCIQRLGTELIPFPGAIDQRVDPPESQDVAASLPLELGLHVVSVLGIFALLVFGVGLIGLLNLCEVELELRLAHGP